MSHSLLAKIVRQPAVMGVLNVTPDSFSDGGRYADVGAAVTRAAALEAEGAAIIDIGGESTRPGHTPIPEAEELARVLPVLAALRGVVVTPLSIDTTKAAVARKAADLGARIVNDQWGFQGDPAMADAVADTGVLAVLMHNRATIDASLSIETELRGFFEVSLGIASRAGIPGERLILDPGIGFGKTPAQQIDALTAIPMLVATFGLPVLVGVSRKSLLGRLTGAAVDDRLPETLAANLFALARGARLFRVHDVAPHVAALKVFAALEGGALDFAAAS